jgi:23S rRNA (uracil1939-C5)-methyltransferase
MSELKSSQECHASVRVLSHKGLGVVDHSDGRVFFVRGAWPGDEIRFLVPENAKSYDEVKLIEFTAKSLDRETAPCPHFGHEAGQCGGCPWMGISYEAQLKSKEQRIKFLLSKNSITPLQLNPIIPSPQLWGYRNRAQFKTDGKLIGYVSEGTNILAPISECRILNKDMQALLEGMKSALPQDLWRPVGAFPWSYLDVDDSQRMEEIIPNKRRPFRQGNTLQNEAMKNWIMASLVNTDRNWPVIEAFCGSGNFTETLSVSGFTSILAAEVRGNAIQELKAKNLSGVQIMEIDMNQKGVWAQIAKRQPLAKILLVDPPREGIDQRRGLFQHLENIQMIIYISCEPATWARDVKDFQSNGFKVAHLTPLDLFPHTPHVEVLSVLTKTT